MAISQFFHLFFLFLLNIDNSLRSSVTVNSSENVLSKSRDTDEAGTGDQGDGLLPRGRWHPHSQEYCSRTIIRCVTPSSHSFWSSVTLAACVATAVFDLVFKGMFIPSLRFYCWTVIVCNVLEAKKTKAQSYVTTTSKIKHL